MRFVWPTADSPFTTRSGDALDLRSPEGAVVKGKVIEILETAGAVYWTHLDEDEVREQRAAENAGGGEGGQAVPGAEVPSSIEVDPDDLLPCAPGAYLLIKLE